MKKAAAFTLVLALLASIVVTCFAASEHTHYWNTKSDKITSSNLEKEWVMGCSKLPSHGHYHGRMVYHHTVIKTCSGKKNGVKCNDTDTSYYDSYGSWGCLYH